jgi:hypothetical protein
MFMSIGEKAQRFIKTRQLRNTQNYKNLSIDKSEKSDESEKLSMGSCSSHLSRHGSNDDPPKANHASEKDSSPSKQLPSCSR